MFTKAYTTSILDTIFTFKLDETLPAKSKLCTYMELKLEFLYLKNIFKPTS